MLPQYSSLLDSGTIRVGSLGLKILLSGLRFMVLLVDST